MSKESQLRTGVGLVLTVKRDGVFKPFLPPTDRNDDEGKLEGVRKVCPFNPHFHPHFLGKPATQGGRVLDHKCGILGGAVDLPPAEIEQNPYSLGEELAREVSEEMKSLLERTITSLNASDFVVFMTWFNQLITTIQNIPNSRFYSFSGILVGQFLERNETGEHTLRGIFNVRAVKREVPENVAPILEKLGFSVPTSPDEVRPYVRVVLSLLGYGTY
jgi:hypothetical protein